MNAIDLVVSKDRKVNEELTFILNRMTVKLIIVLT